jgi:hypothetical protein
MSIYVKLVLVIIAGLVTATCLYAYSSYNACMRDCARLGLSRGQATASCDRYTIANWIGTRPQ